MKVSHDVMTPERLSLFYLKVEISQHEKEKQKPMLVYYFSDFKITYNFHVCLLIINIP